MTTLRFNPDGLHIIEMFGELGVTDLLPGLIPEGDQVGEEWDDELTGLFARMGE